jgi:hypothetical protein
MADIRLHSKRVVKFIAVPAAQDALDKIHQRRFRRAVAAFALFVNEKIEIYHPAGGFFAYGKKTARHGLFKNRLSALKIAVIYFVLREGKNAVAVFARRGAGYVFFQAFDEYFFRYTIFGEPIGVFRREFLEFFKVIIEKGGFFIRQRRSGVAAGAADAAACFKLAGEPCLQHLFGNYYIFVYEHRIDSVGC